MQMCINQSNGVINYISRTSTGWKRPEMLYHCYDDTRIILILSVAELGTYTVKEDITFIVSHHEAEIHNLDMVDTKSQFHSHSPLA